MVKKALTESEKIEKARKVANYLIGDIQNGTEPKNMVEIQKIMGFKSKTSVKFYKALAIEKNFLTTDETGKAILPKKSDMEKFNLYTENHKILDDWRVAEWYEIQLSKKKHSGIVIAKQMLNILERFFNTLKITPEMLVIDKDKKAVEKYRDDFVRAYKAGTDWRQNNSKRGGTETLVYRLNYALASFCGEFGISWTRGDEKMSRKIVGHGNYANVRLTQKEFIEAEKFLIENFGIDSDEYRWFWIGVETCARHEALFSMRSDYEEIGTEKKPTLVMQVFESKTKHLQKGIQKKFIKRAKTIESIKAVRSRGSANIIENKDNLPIYALKKKLSNANKSLFLHLGKAEDSYFCQHTSHVMRHIGSHRLLEAGNYSNHVLVAKVGGWFTVDELIKSYGEIPPEKINEELDKLDL